MECVVKDLAGWKRSFEFVPAQSSRHVPVDQPDEACFGLHLDNDRQLRELLEQTKPELRIRAPKPGRTFSIATRLYLLVAVSCLQER